MITTNRLFLLLPQTEPLRHCILVLLEHMHHPLQASAITVSMFGSIRRFTANHFRVCFGITRAHCVFSLHYSIYNLKQDHMYYDMDIAIVKNTLDLSHFSKAPLFFLMQCFRCWALSLQYRWLVKQYWYSVTFQTRFPLSRSH